MNVPFFYFLVIRLIAYLITNIHLFFDTANFFKDIFKIFSKVLKIKEKKNSS